MAVREALRWLQGRVCSAVSGRRGGPSVTSRRPRRRTRHRRATAGGSRCAPVPPSSGVLRGRRQPAVPRRRRIHPLLRTALLPHNCWPSAAAASPFGGRADRRERLPPARGDARAPTAVLRSAVDALSLPPFRTCPTRPTRPTSGEAAALVAPRATLAGSCLRSPLSESRSWRAAAIKSSAPRRRNCRRCSTNRPPARIAFRAVGEGTGHTRDLDVFDQTPPSPVRVGSPEA